MGVGGKAKAIIPVAFQAASLLVALYFGIVFSQLTHNAIPTVIALAFIPFTLVAHSLSRRSLRSTRLGPLTGATLAPPPVGERRERWIGGASLRGWSGRAYVQPPLATLEIGSSVVSITPRAVPPWLQGIDPLHERVADIVSAFPVRGTLGRVGIGFYELDEPVWYFWTTRREELLDALAAVGVTVTGAERRVPRW